ncbi:hypothetical protein ACFE04_015066 [Oxalis oulophora]
MSVDPHDKEFWSPTNSELVAGNQQSWSSLFFGTDDSKSELNSPNDSELGSTETDSSEEGDDYMAQLTRHMTHSMFQEDDDTFNEQYSKLHRLKQEQLMKQHHSLYNKNHVNVSPKLQSTQRPPRNFNKVRSFDNNINRLTNSQNGQWDAPNPNNQMRTVILNGSTSGTRLGGTGVFLPRVVGNSSGVGNSINESRKKPVCSTVLIPARVLQALQLHYDKLDATSRSKSFGNTNRQGAFEGGRSHMYTQEQEPQGRTLPTWNHQEIGLPQEWTY